MIRRRSFKPTRSLTTQGDRQWDEITNLQPELLDVGGGPTRKEEVRRIGDGLVGRKVSFTD